MFETEELITYLLNNPEHKMSGAEVESLLHEIERCPAAAALPAALLLRHAQAESHPQAVDRAKIVFAASATDRQALFRVAAPDGARYEDFFHFETPEPTSPSTTDTIDTFLATYGHQSAEEDALIERLIFNPVPDYSEVLAREEEEPTEPVGQPIDDTMAAIDNFLSHQEAEPLAAEPQADAEPESEPETVDIEADVAVEIEQEPVADPVVEEEPEPEKVELPPIYIEVPPPYQPTVMAVEKDIPAAETIEEPAEESVQEPVEESVEPTVEEPVQEPVEESVEPTAEEPVQEPEKPMPGPSDTLLSESLAKIFIKQGRYERAYEIISNLNLNFPEKSCYFADQLRFLQKLIKIKQTINPASTDAKAPENGKNR